MTPQFRLFVLLPALLALFLIPALGDTPPDRTGPPAHLAQAQHLVENLKGAQENVYGGGKRHIVWEADHCAARTVCSSFMTLLLEHTYGWSSDTFRTWMESANPEADAYHDAIAEGRGFEHVVHITALKPGDFLAVKYTDHHVSSNGVEDTGHVMLVNDAPVAIDSEKPIISGMHQYTVTIIDSSASGHGPTDTRHLPGGAFTGGIGRGVIRLYANDDGKIFGYTWSDTRKSPFYSAPDRDIVAGRLTK